MNLRAISMTAALALAPGLATASGLMIQQVTQDNVIGGARQEVLDAAALGRTATTAARLGAGANDVTLQARQVGAGNRLGLDVRANGSVSVRSDQQGRGNRAEVAASGGQGAIRVTQRGDNNDAQAALGQLPRVATDFGRTLEQTGNNNRLSVSVTDAAGPATASTSRIAQGVQRGNGNVADVAATVTQAGGDASVLVEQVGHRNSLTASWSGESPQVFLRQRGDDNVVVLRGQDLVDSALPIRQEGNGNYTEVDARGRVVLQIDMVGDRNRANLRVNGDQGSGRSDGTVQRIDIRGSESVVGWACSGAPGAQTCAAPAEQTGDNHFFDVRIGRNIVGYAGGLASCVVPGGCGSSTASDRNLVEFVQGGDSQRLGIGIVGNENHAMIYQWGLSRNDALIGISGNSNRIAINQGTAAGGGSHSATVGVQGNGNDVTVLQNLGPASQVSFGLSANNTRVVAQNNGTGGANINVLSGTGTPVPGALMRVGN